MDKENNDIAAESEVKEAVLNYDKLYTYADYLKWDDDKRRELIDGVPYLMSAPGTAHQKLSMNLSLLFATFLKGKTCQVYAAPFDVRLNADTLDDTVVQPDLIIVCDSSKLDKAGCKGVPDMVIEILSPSTSHYDKTTKFNKYQESGIREYWIIDPKAKKLEVNTLNDGSYITSPYTAEDIVPVHVLDGCDINMQEVFEGV